MTAYPVVFHMPTWIADGIASGVFEVVGGVVRRVDGKQVVMWLRPALDGTKALVPIAPRLPLLAGGAALSTAIAVSGAVITVVAFALLSAQVGRVERRLDAALAKLDEIKEDTGWLRQALLAWKKGDLGGALLAAQTMEANAQFEDLTGPLAVFESARLFYEHQMREILRQPAPLSLGPAFAEFANLYVLATGAKGRALTLLRGDDEAERAVAEDASAFRDLRRLFLAPLDDPRAGLIHLVDLTDDAEAALVESLPLIPAAAAAEYMRLQGLGRDPLALAEMREASTAAPDDPPGAVVVAALAPPGWSPELRQ